MIRLLVPDTEMELQAMEFKRQFYENGEHTICGSYKLDQERYTYAEWLDIINCNRSNETANPKYGVSDTFFAATEDGTLVGIINIRYDQTPFYKDSGNIGYSVIPCHRKKGYATEMLRSVLKLAKLHGLSEVKLVCATENIASKKTIIKCGGKRSRVFGDEKKKEEYIISL